MPTGEQSGLLTRTATTEGVSLYADEKLTVFLGTRINDSSEQSNCLDQLPRFFQKKASLNGS